MNKDFLKNSCIFTAFSIFFAIKVHENANLKKKRNFSFFKIYKEKDRVKKEMVTYGLRDIHNKNKNFKIMENDPLKWALFIRSKEFSLSRTFFLKSIGKE